MSKRDPIPENFASIEEAVEFWETHSLADYWDETTEVHFDINLGKSWRLMRHKRFKE